MQVLGVTGISRSGSRQIREDPVEEQSGSLCVCAAIRRVERVKYFTGAT
jgi:hypothetical protein